MRGAAASGVRPQAGASAHFYCTFVRTVRSYGVSQYARLGVSTHNVDGGLSRELSTIPARREGLFSRQPRSGLFFHLLRPGSPQRPSEPPHDDPCKGIPYHICFLFLNTDDLIFPIHLHRHPGINRRQTTSERYIGRVFPHLRSPSGVARRSHCSLTVSGSSGKQSQDWICQVTLYDLLSEKSYYIPSIPHSARAPFYNVF